VAEDAKALKFGFLTMDQKQRILVLNANDKMAKKLPLVGVWLYGVTI
jgi:hypothetical protein